MKVIETKSATISNAAKAISHADFAWTAGSLERAEIADVTPIGADIVLRVDGGDPTTTVGHYASAKDLVSIPGGQAVRALKMIRAAATDATVTITLWES